MPETQRARTSRVAELLGSRGAVIGAVVLALLPALPMLSLGLVADDHLQYAMVRHGIRAPWDLFSFFSGVPADMLGRIQRGEAPWFLAPDLKHALFRPLPSLEHFLDYRLWGGLPALAHLHSLLWFAALGATIAWVYRSFEGPRWTVPAATIVYLWSPAIGFSAAWLAGRNTLMSTTFGMAAVGAHHRFRGAGSRPARAAAVALLVASLACGESSAGPLAFLLAYAAFFETGPKLGRALSVTPYVLLGAAWWSAEAVLGYGVGGNAVYYDPHSGLTALLRLVADRYPELLLHALGRAHLEALGGFRPVEASWPLIAVAVGVGAVLVPRVLVDRVLRFWVLAALMSMLPFCLMVPQSRLLAAAGVGVSIALVRCLEGIVTAPPASRAASAVRLFSIATLGAILVAQATLGLACMLSVTRGVRDVLGLPVDPADSERATARVLARYPGEDVVVGMGDWLRPHTARLVLEEHDVPGPRSAMTLVGTPVVALDRPDDRTLVVRAPLGVLGQTGRILRASPFAVGERVQAPRCVVEILETKPDLGPTRVRYTFDAPLEDPSIRWLNDGPAGLVSQQPPPIGFHGPDLPSR